MRFLILILSISIVTGYTTAQNCSLLPDTIFGCLEEQITLSAGVQSGTYFDGVDDFILMDHGAIIGTQAFSVSFEAMTESNSAMDVLTQSCGTDCWADLRLGFNTPQCGLEGVSFKSPAHFATWPFEVSDGNWHTYTYVFGMNNNFSFSNIQVYVDGINIMDIESTFTFCGHNWGGWTYNPIENPIRIGKGDPLGGFFSGYLRNLGIWNTALDSAYIAEYSGQPDIADSALISFWRLDEMAGGYFEDLKGENHGLPMGGIHEHDVNPEGEVLWFNGSGLPTQQIFSNESGYYNLELYFQDGSSCSDSIWVEIEPSPYIDLNNNGICDHLDGSGCLDPNACNYDPLQTDSIACIFPVIGGDCDSGAFICTNGTAWNPSCQCCVPDLTSTPNADACGPGTYWDEGSQSCLPEITCEDDLDGDGIIGVNDLMQLLSSFGSDCPPSGDTGGGPEAAEFSCGDPINYHGYDYATVQIGEQCWFAENLRTSQYSNGDDVPNHPEGADWQAAASAESGAWVYFSNNPDSGASFGKLYNWYVTVDERGICPTGWHVPENTEWGALVDHYGGAETAAVELKGNYSDEWFGNGSSKFNALPGGFRDWGNSVFFFQGTSGDWWTSSHQGSGFWRGMDANSDSVHNALYGRAMGNSIRCLKD